MDRISYSWHAVGRDHVLRMVRVVGTGAGGYAFGEGDAERRIAVGEFWIGTTPVTQALWAHVMGAGSNPSVNQGMELPVENVSWDGITGAGGFLECINQSTVREAVASQAGSRRGRFRLPSETEWEYAARGGPRWGDGFRFSGGDEVEDVAWCDRRHGDYTQTVGRKAANQLGIYDMSGNVWEWCQDTFVRDVGKIPGDGSAYAGEGEERVLRGGCFHNWPAHCTVSKRYEIGREFHDGCIGFRLVFG